MKKYIVSLLAVIGLIEVCIRIYAGIIVLAGSGVNINANSTSNLTMLAAVGTFTLPAQSIYLSEGGITNTNLCIITNRLTFDGTNFFNIPQTYMFGVATNAVSNVLWVVTNISFPVYEALSVSNGQGQVITNFAANLQTQ